MAAEHGMIEPFEPHQVKMSGDKRLVSYGTSSYGYDIRCSNEFKIFTNINSAIVDPKNFDANSFVDFRGDVCIIPPNSFALARTVEYFRIPRKVLTICLGKCVTGDTRVVHADTGDYRPIRDWRGPGRTLAFDGRRIVGQGVKAWACHGEHDVYEVQTQNGYRLRATAQHPLLTKAGWRPLGALGVGDQIAVGGHLGGFGREPLAGAAALGRAFAVRLRAGLHDDVPAPVFRARAADLWQFLAGVLDGTDVLWGAERTVIESLQHLFDRFGVASRVAAAAGGFALTAEQWMWHAQASLADGTTGRMAAPVPAAGRFETISMLAPAGRAPVYDLEIPRHHNFVANGLVVHNSTYARCGIIVNVTPFEPEWEGYVTLEFSNTTPLPAKIYANEGVAQVVFFEADEECETSYQDRGGKYQGQTGVTLPKT